MIRMWSYYSKVLLSLQNGLNELTSIKSDCKKPDLTIDVNIKKRAFIVSVGIHRLRNIWISIILIYIKSQI